MSGKTRLDFSGMDFFRAARDELNARLFELSDKYANGGDFGHNLVARARDAVAMVNLGFTAAEEAWDPIEDARDIVLLDHVLALDRNESDAGSLLHEFLSNQLHRGTLTPTAACLLAAMHNALSRGIPADDAMLTKPAGGRPSNAKSHREIIRYMEGEDAMRELMAAAGRPDDCRTKAESFREAARIFGVSIKTVRNVLSAKR